jgi:hypothetical protein
VSAAAGAVASSSGPRRAVRAALAAAAALLGVAGCALAFTAVWPEGPPAPRPATLSPADAAAARTVVGRARRLVSVTPAELGYTLRVAGPVAGLRGQTDTAARTITLFVSPRDATHVVAHDLAHELGHAYDARRLTGAERAAYLRARGVPRAAWFPAAGAASDYRSGAGDFAEVFALCHAPSPVYRSRLASRPADPCGVLPAPARGTNLGGRS